MMMLHVFGALATVLWGPGFQLLVLADRFNLIGSLAPLLSSGLLLLLSLWALAPGTVLLQAF
jgi:hypothetical protein